MNQEYVSLDIVNHIGYIEFFHPDKNALPFRILKALEQTVIKAGKHPDIKVIVLKSGGDRVFCAGANFKELVAIDSEASGQEFFSGFARVINAMRTCPKFIIGCVQGKAVGGGVGIVAATDYCLAAEAASVRLSELGIGLGPFVIEPVVSHKMGKTSMLQMTLNPETFYSANWACDKGLFAQVVQSSKALDDAVNLLAETLVSYNSEALIALKSTLWENTSHWDTLLMKRAAISGKLVLSDFTKEKLKRFREK